MNNDLPDINHKTVVFTKHAREQLNLRRVGEDMIIQVMRNPGTTYNEDNGKIKFIGKVMGTKLHAVCKPILEENKWLVITLWIRGEDDAGNFVSHGKYRRRNQNDVTKFYTLMFFLLILLVAVVYYWMQLG